jgi:hypothetical protein
MGWATFWAFHSQTHRVTLLNFNSILLLAFHSRPSPTFMAGTTKRIKIHEQRLLHYLSTVDTSELRTMVVLIAYESWLSNIDVAISINHFYQALLVRIPAGYVHSFRENRAI